MTRRRLLLAALGGVLVAVGVVYGIDDQTRWTWTGGVAFGVFAISIVALVIGGWKIRGTLDTAADEPTVSWATAESFANPAPERSDRRPSLSSDELATTIERAGASARGDGTIEDGLAVVRPPLRTALLEALVEGGQSRANAEAAVEDGSWTDDQIAASVLEAELEAPDRPLHERIRAWLFPERVVRERSRRAMAAVADAADETLPSVPGQSAPRTKPVLQPRLEELRRGADGRLQRAIDPMATARGPQPPQPRLAADTDDATDADDGEGDYGPHNDSRSSSDTDERPGVTNR